MNEQFFASANLQMCEHLAAIRKSGDWHHYAASFDVYVQLRWSLSKTRAKLLCDFAKFCKMVGQEKLKIPGSPENVRPILMLPQKRWLEIWAICINYADGPINAKHCTATMEQFGFIARKKIPEKILNSRRVRHAAKTMAQFKDGEALVEQVGVKGLGGDWDMAVRVTIDADQAKTGKQKARR